jgi:hypothetical protein
MVYGHADIKLGITDMKPSIQQTVMRRAWAIFRQTYKYPQIKFADIGRKCFAWALRQGWIEARATARLSALSAAAKAERIETLEDEITRAGYIDNGRQWKVTITAYRDEIRALRT